MRLSLVRATIATLVVLSQTPSVPAAARAVPASRLPPFTGNVSPLDRATRKLMIGRSWHPGCPVPLRDLRLVTLSYVGFDGRAHTGELVVHRWYADDYVRVFRRLYEERYPIRQMRLVDHYGADDDRSMAADNTSAFNCRLRAGSTTEWSQHAYGRAIDIDPVENPFVTPTHVSPPAGAAYVDRTQQLPGMIHLHDPVWWAFHSIGWDWGGTWQGTIDYQHFSANGRRSRRRPQPRAPPLEPSAAGKGRRAPRRTLSLRPCRSVAGARCGTLQVPLDRTDPTQGTIGIRVEVHPRRRRDLPLLGTIVAVQGGPGYSTLQSRDSYLALFHPLLARYRLLMVDNRGTGASGAIDCPALQSYRGSYVRNAGACGRQLGATAVDYGTADAADDLADVLEALDVGKVDLYGDSYGTFFGQVFAVRHPDLLRSLVLDSAYPVAGLDPWYRDTNRALRAAFRRACRRDPGCAAVGGDPIRRLARLTRIVRRRPITGVAYDADGVLRHVTVDVGTLITFTTAAASSFDVYRELDPAVRAYLAPDRDAAPLLRLAAENLYFGGAGDFHGFSEGLYLATNCNDIPLPFDRNASVAERRKEYAAAIRTLHRIDPHAFAPFTVNEWLSAPLSGVQPYDSCILWPRPARPNPPLPSPTVYPSIPVLVLSGDLDSLTSPGGARQVAAEFPNSTFVDVRNMNHIAALFDFGRCASAIVVRFVRTLSAGDTSCAAHYNEVRVVDAFAEHASELGPMAPALRAAEVAADTVADVIARWWVMYGYHGRGLRGGRFSTSGLEHVRFRLDGVRWVSDAAVSGSVDWELSDGRVRAHVSVRGPGVATGNLWLHWSDWQERSVATAKGTVGGRHVRLSFPAP